MQKSVLVIDDDDSLRRVIEYTLDEAGFKVLTASDGRKGLQLFKEELPPVVLTDIQMPGISGYDVLQSIRTSHPEVRVIIVTAFGTVEQAVDAMKDGAFDYLTKPFSRDELTLVVKRAFTFLELKEENVRLKQELSVKVDFDHLVGISDAMQTVFERVRRVAPSDAAVLIGGESGTGKELIARAIHYGSSRRDGPFVPVNCAAIPAELLESELFGHVKGAFTGAVRDRKGKFEQANGGTLFLDEIGDLSPHLQPKLLRVLQEMEIEPVGADQLRKIDVRIVSASNRNLEEEIKTGDFREDLYYRLSVIPVNLPPLRERKQDIPVLVQHFLDLHSQDERLEMSREAMSKMMTYLWPGNVRELQNVVEQVIILRRGKTIEVQDLPQKVTETVVSRRSQVLNLPEGGFSLVELEKEAVLQALQRCNWNQTRAAAFLQVPRHTLVYRMEKYAITRD
ncbi:MAG: sigma-54-dependent Fis family transcriptional regulator [Desulfuromonadales bacterium]|nr:sigma-54-dependent Fis family transcriptional regulator [Desulfuromonadales bacterium]